jgi:hypothetical protein
MGLIGSLYSTYIGMYMVQSVCHSFLAAAVADISILAWKIDNPVLKQRFRIMVILLPLFSFPIYQAINPDRGSISFRLEALFDTGRWLNLVLWGKFTLSPLFILILLITALVFLFQEMLPILRHVFESKRTESETVSPHENSALKKALDSLPGEKPDVIVINNEELILFSSTGREPKVFISTGLLEEFSPEQLQVALAHEAAHIKRSRKPILVMVFIFRVIMLFNPIALIEFRKTVQEEEKICDYIAISMTKKPHVLAEILDKFRSGPGDTRADEPTRLSEMTSAVERYSHDMLMKSRIRQLEQEPAYNPGEGWFQFLLAVAVIIALNYFIV